MEELTYMSLADAMTRCRNNKHYQVCVIFKYEQSFSEVVHGLEKIDLGYSVHMEAVYRPREMISDARLAFGGGSYIYFTVIDSSIPHGRKYNEILYEAGIDNDFVRSQLYPLLVSYKAVDGSPYVTEIDTEPFDAELLEYLDGFNIIKEA